MDLVMVKRVLMIAFHFPPVVGSSGMQRTLKFSSYLLEHGWEPTVLTVSPWAYRKTRDDQLGEIPDRVRVIRAWAVDAARQFSIRGRYPSILALPDSWQSWRLSAVPIGLAYLRKKKFDLIWSTYPIATAHLIAATIHRMSKVPWVADFRDMMVEDDYPDDTRVRRSYLEIERQAMVSASRIVVTSPGTKSIYENRYSDEDANKLVVIRNGYDEENFRSAGVYAGSSENKPVVLAHSGLLYPCERDPSHFFEALSELRNEGHIDALRIQVKLRATGHDNHHAKLIEKFDIGELVTLEPGIAYDKALAEMMSVDGLLLFQAANCNHQIPAKLYEYFRAGTPIFALTDPAGDTAQTIFSAGLSNVAPLDSTAEIKVNFMRFVETIENGDAVVVTEEVTSKYSRRSQTGELAKLFNQVVS